MALGADLLEDGDAAVRVARLDIVSEQLTNLKFYEIQEFFIIHHVALIHEHDHRGHVHLTSEQLLTAPENWHERKEGYLLSLQSAPRDALLVSCADKLHNARSLLRDLIQEGDQVCAAGGDGARRRPSPTPRCTAPGPRPTSTASRSFPRA